MSLMSPPDSARAFVRTFLHGMPQNLHSYLWLNSVSKNRKVTRSYAGSINPDVIAGHAIDQSFGFDVYIGMGLSHTPLQRGERLKAGVRECAGIMGVWADVDFGTEGHKKGHLPENGDAAYDMLDAVISRFVPTMGILSGGGLHLYWLFREPLIASDTMPTDEIRALVARWSNMLISTAARAGYALDSVMDLERVLRVPGTLNHKHEPPRPVTFDIFQPDTRYAWQELAAACKDYTVALVKRSDEIVKRSASKIIDVAEGLIVDSQRNMPALAWEALYTNSRKFRQTWNRARRDLDESGASASEYEFSLMMQALRAGWHDQDIIDMVTAWRVKHGQEPADKPLHYFEFSLRKARGLLADGGEDVPPPGDPPAPGDPGEDPEAPRRAALEQLSLDLGLTRRGAQLLRILRYDGREPHFYLIIQTAQGEKRIDMGGAGNMATHLACQKMLFGAGYNVQATRETWNAVRDRMLMVVEAEIIVEASVPGIVKAMLVDYLERRPIHDSIEDADETKDPFRKKGRISIYLHSFATYCAVNAPGEKMGRDMLANGLKIIGCKVVQEAIKTKRGLSTRSVWQTPETLEDDPTPDNDAEPDEDEPEAVNE